MTMTAMAQWGKEEEVKVCWTAEVGDVPWDRSEALWEDAEAEAAEADDADDAEATEADDDAITESANVVSIWVLRQEP